MEFRKLITNKLKLYGIGRRKLHDELFSKDEPPARLGIYDVDDENLCHEILQSVCHIPGCKFASESLLDFENHYNASHRYSCGQCKKVLPSPHLLDLHIQESHDSFFAVMSAKKPSYCCYIEDCPVKFNNIEERREHCLSTHKLPKDFRFDQKPKSVKSKKSKVQNKQDQSSGSCMDIDIQADNFQFHNNKTKSFSMYKGKKFTSNKKTTPSQDVNMEEIVEDLKESLPK